MDFPAVLKNLEKIAREFFPTADVKALMGPLYRSVHVHIKTHMKVSLGMHDDLVACLRRGVGYPDMGVVVKVHSVRPLEHVQTSVVLSDETFQKRLDAAMRKRWG